jgi:hypothetical protein
MLDSPGATTPGSQVAHTMNEKPSAPDSARLWDSNDYNQCYDCIAVLDATGTICYRNAAWHQMVSDASRTYAWTFQEGVRFLDVLEATFHVTPDYLYAMCQSIEAVLHGERDYVEHVHPVVYNGQCIHFLVRLHAYPLRGMRGVLVQQRMFPADLA